MGGWMDSVARVCALGGPSTGICSLLSCPLCPIYKISDGGGGAVAMEGAGWMDG